MGRDHALIDLQGQHFGFLKVLRREGTIQRTATRTKQGALAAWRCECTCRKQVVVAGTLLRSGGKLACNINGHHYRMPLNELAKEEQRIWHGMIQRCTNKKTPNWKRYGARGIRVCKRWKHFENFLSDMGPRPSPEHSVDRYPNRNGNYEPTNCRWATKTEQQRNTDTCIYIEVDGKSIPLIEYLQKVGLNSRMVRKRLQRGWSVEDAISIGVREPDP